MIISISIRIVIRMSIMSRESSSSSSSFVSDYEYPALCIPRALGKITQDELHSIIKSSGLGEISKIVMKPKEFVLPRWEQTTPAADTADHTATDATAVRQTVSYNNVYIYFKKWNTHDPRVQKYRDNVMNGQTIKIVHNTIPTPVFWRCVAANFTTPSRNKINKIDI